MEAALNDPHISHCDQKMRSMNELTPLLDELVKTGRPIVFIAEDVEGEALATLVVNQIR